MNQITRDMDIWKDFLEHRKELLRYGLEHHLHLGEQQRQPRQQEAHQEKEELDLEKINLGNIGLGNTNHLELDKLL